MGDASSSGRAASPADLPASDLLQRAREQTSRLVREELALARGDMTEKGKHAGVGVGLFGGGGALALYGGGALTAAVVLALDHVMPAPVAALVVGVVLLGLAGLFALSGKKQVSRAMPLVPKSTADGLRADADAVKGAAKERGRA
jgi:pilus assembly protein TadC